MNQGLKRHRSPTTKAILLLLSNLLHRLLRFFFSMDSPILLPFDDVYDYDSPLSSFSRPSFIDPGESWYLVSFSWFEEAVCSGRVLEGEIGNVVRYVADVKLIDNDDDDNDLIGFGESEIVLTMTNHQHTGRIEDDHDDCGNNTLALVSEWMFLTALKWHYDKEIVGSLQEENGTRDLFSLQIRLLYVHDNDLLAIKISEKDNEMGVFRCAYRIFGSRSGMLQIWDFSGQTSQLFLEFRKQFMELHQSNEIQLELKIYGLSSSIKDEESRKEDTNSMINGPSSSSSVVVDGCMDEVNLFPSSQPSFSSGSGYLAGTGRLGLTGLDNLGNTCYMNSSVQCLVHTPKIVDYFLGNFRKDLNFDNPLGMNGKLAISFGDLLRKLWAAGTRSMRPTLFKSTISSFAPQFSGYNQHDSQEFLAFLLDGLHEDLNRVKSKPYIQPKDDDSRPDGEVADEYWKNHLSRNDSIIVDLCQGQFRSTLVCPVCRKLSITFDPFMYLSLPLPSEPLRNITLTVMSSDGVTLPCEVMVTVPINGTCKDLVEALTELCSLKEDETFIMAEIYNNAIFRYLEDPADLVELIRDSDKLVAYRLPKDVSGSPLIEFMHRQEDKEKSYYYSPSSSLKKFGIPLLARMSNFSKGSEIQEVFLKLVNAFAMPKEEFMNDDGDASESANVADTANNEFEFHLESVMECIKIQMEEAVPITNFEKPIKFVVTWPENMIKHYDTSTLCQLPEVCNHFDQNPISLYKCVEAFLKEEPLGPDDMWYCPNCKEHRQASKKLDLWRLPEILVVHLKRFSYNRSFNNKLDSFVDFPVDELDISNYVICKNHNVSRRYVLYAVSNHYGGFGGGHYTAFVQHGQRWYEFNDSQISPIGEKQIKTAAAYVLFYRRV